MINVSGILKRPAKESPPKRNWLSMVAVISACLAFTLCSTDNGAPSEELKAAVARDEVPFAISSIPDEMVTRLAQSKVVVVGETHLIQEQGTLLGKLMQGLYAQGFRQLLLEWPHMADWLLINFVGDTGLEPSWTPPNTMVGGSVVTAVRDFNRTLPAGAEKVSVRAIDVNLIEYGGAASFRNMLNSLSRHLADRGPITVFMNSGYFTPEINQFRNELQNGRVNLISSWGANWYSIVAEMADVELASIDIRANRESNYDQTARDRENVIRNMADLRLNGYGHNTVVSVGNTHAQKSSLMGTAGVEWLGDYLVH
jgi:hypothetical protein